MTRSATSSQAKETEDTTAAVSPFVGEYGPMPGKSSGLMASKLPVGAGTVFGAKRNTSVSSKGTGVTLPRTDDVVQSEEFGGVVNEVGGELIVRSFNKFLEEQYKKISEIDSTADGIDKNISYRNALKDAAEKIGMYRRTFTNSGKVLNAATASEGLDMLSELEDVYRGRMKETALPKGYLDAVSSGSKTPAADYIEATGGEDATSAQLAAVRDMYEGESGIDAMRAEISTLENTKDPEIVALQKEQSTLKRKIAAYKRGDRTSYRTTEQFEKAKKQLEAVSKQLENSSISKSAEIASMRRDLRDAENEQTIQKYTAYTERDDFEEYAAKGAAIENPTLDEAGDTGIELFGGKIFIGSKGKEIRNKVSFAKENATMLKITAGNGGDGTLYKYSYVNEDEEKIYNYILARYGELDADKYLEDLEATLNDRIAGERADRIEGTNPVGRTLLTGLSAVEQGLDQARTGFQGAAAALKGDTTESVPSIEKLTAEKVSKDLSGVGKVLFDLTSTTAHMVPSILAGIVSPIAAGAVTGISAAGNGYQDMVDLGYDANQARAYGAMVGASEALLQYAFSGISAVGGKVTGNVIKKAVDQVDNAIAKIAIQFGGSIASEALEEGTQEILEPIIRAIATGEDVEGINWENVAYSALLGGLSGGLLGGVPSSVSTVAKSIKAKNSYSTVQSELVAEGLASTEGTASRKLAEKYSQILENGGDLTGTQLAALVEANEEAFAEETDAGDAEADGERQYKFDGYAEDGRGMYTSNFPKGTPKAAKSERILNYIQNVWSKNPISLKVTGENGETKTILAEFDPTYDESQNTPTDASKLMGGNRHGTASEQRVTLDLADDYYQILEDSSYNYSRDEIGKDTSTHEGVSQWHYFVNDILFAEHGSENYEPYRVSINIKEKADGNFVYSFSAEKEKPTTQRTLHAAVNGDIVTANGQFFNSIPQSDGSVNTPYYSDSVVTSPAERVQETRWSAKKQEITAEDSAAFENVAEEFGLSVKFYEGNPNTEGDGYYKNGTIWLNRYARDPIAVVFSHELSHYAERAGWWSSYKDLALREMQRRSGKDLDTLRAEATELYARHGVTLDTAGAEAELVAQFTQEYVLGNSEELDRICEENPSLMQRVLDFIVDFLEKIGIINEDTRRIDRARRTLAGALRDVKRTNTNIMGAVKTENQSSQFYLPQKGERRDPTTLTEQDLNELLELAKSGALDNGTYFPVRINTPALLLEAVKEMAKREGIFDTAELNKIAEDRPIAVQVEKIRQALAKKDEWNGRGRAHELEIDDIVEIVKKMDNPAHIVYETSTDRFVEIIKHKTAESKNAFAVVEFDNFKGEQHLNGYDQGTYNILVTLYPAEAQERVTKLLKNKDNIVFDLEKLKGNLQLTSGIRVPSVLNKSPFANSIPQDPDGVKKYSFSTSAGSLDADAVAEAERMENEGYTEDEIYDTVGMWRDSETGRWMKDNDTAEIEKYRDEPEVNDGRRNGTVADPDVFGEAISEAERMEADGKHSAEIYEDLGLWRNSRTRDWMTYDSEPRNVSVAGIQRRNKDAVDRYRGAVAEGNTEGSEVSSARGDLVLDSLEAITNEEITGELESEIYDTVELITDMESAMNPADTVIPYEGEGLTEEVFGVLMEEESSAKDALIKEILEARGILGEISEAERAGIDAMARAVLKVVDEYGIVENRYSEIAANAGAIVRGHYPLSDGARAVYDTLVLRDKTDSSFASTIEYYEESLNRSRDELEMARRNSGSESAEILAEVEERIRGHEEKLEGYRTDRERMWAEYEEKVAMASQEEIDNALFYFEYGTAAKALAFDILAATDSMTAESEREDIARRILFVKREIAKQEALMDADAIAAAERLSEVGYIESHNEDIHYLADLYTSLRSLAAGEHSTVLINLGVMIDTPITNRYGNASGFRISVARREQLERRARAIARRLNPAEKEMAKGIADGTRHEAEIPDEYDRGGILSFADVWRQYLSESMRSKSIQKFRARTAEEYTERLSDMVGDTPVMKIRQHLLSVLTPERVMRYAFGDDLGAELTDELISPIHSNEAERIRFINRLLKAVDMRYGKISKSESAHVQQLGEAGATLDLYDKGMLEAKKSGMGYWEYAGQRKNQFSAASSELLHRELKGYMLQLKSEATTDSFYNNLVDYLASGYEAELVEARKAELTEKARLERKSKVEKISKLDSDKIRAAAKERATEEVARLRENEEAYVPGEYAHTKKNVLEDMVNSTSPEDTIWNVKVELDEYAAKHIRKNDTSEDAVAERDHWVDEQIRRRLTVADHLRGQYNMLFDGINDMLVTHGYEPIPFRRNYFPHMQPENMSAASKLLASFGFHPEVTDLPSQIAGRTETFKPGHRWAPFMQRRLGTNTEYDAVRGFEQYLNYASDIIYHMDDIQKLRAFSNFIRQKHSTEEVSAEIDRLREEYYSGRITKEDFDGQREKLLEKSELTEDAGKFATWLDDYTNKLSGKQVAFDRGIEHLLGRRVLNVGEGLQNLFARSAVVGNISSALMNTSQIPMAAAFVGSRNIARAVEDMVSGHLNEMYDFDGRSDFLTGKKGVDRLSSKGALDKFSDTLSIPFGMVDDFSVRLIQRGIFFKLVDSGVGINEAIDRSDRMAQAMMASRTKGARPILFESRNFVTKLVTMFQLEVSNALQFIGSDLSYETKRMYGAGGAWKRKLAAEIAKYLVLAFLYNLGLEQLIGYKVLPMDVIGMTANAVAHMYGTSQRDIVNCIVKGVGSVEDLEFQGRKGIWPTIKEFAGDAFDDLPFAANIIQALGWKDGRMPMYDLTPLWEKIAPGVAGAFTAEDTSDAKASLMTAGDGVLEMVKGLIPGGNQVYKTARGIKAYMDEGVYNDRGELMYPVEQDGMTLMQSLMFGPSSLHATDQYYEDGNGAYGSRDTDIINALKETGLSTSEAVSILDALDDAGAEANDSGDSDDYEFSGDAIADLDEVLFGDDTENGEKSSRYDLAYKAMLELGLSPEQEYILYRDKIASKKERTVLQAIETSGGDAVTASQVLGDLRSAADKREELSIVMQSELDDSDAAVLFYGTVATKSEREAFDALRDGEGEALEDVFVTLAAQKEISSVPDAEWKEDNDVTKSAARFDKLQQSPISETSKAVYYYEQLATDTDVVALDELDKLDSDMGEVYGIVAATRYAADKGEQYGILIDSDLSGDEVYTILKYKLTNSDKREDLNADLDDVIAAGGTIDDYLVAKEAVWGIESDKDRNGNAISNSKSKKMIKAIREALPEAEYNLLVVLYELCGVAKSAYQKKNTGLLGSDGLSGGSGLLNSGDLLNSGGLLG